MLFSYVFLCFLNITLSPFSVPSLQINGAMAVLTPSAAPLRGQGSAGTFEESAKNISWWFQKGFSGGFDGF